MTDEEMIAAQMQRDEENRRNQRNILIGVGVIALIVIILVLIAMMARPRTVVGPSVYYP